MSQHAVAETFIPEGHQESVELLTSTLGAHAIQLDLTTHAYLSASETATTKGNYLAAQLDKLEAKEQNKHLIGELDKVRGLLGIFDKANPITSYNHQLLDQYLGSYFTDVDPAGTGHTTLTSWLADKKRGATNGQLLNLLRGHVHEIATQQQSPATKEAIQRAKQDFVAFQTEAIKQGFFHSHAQKAAESVDNISVRVGDLLDTVLKSRAAYFTHGKNFIVITQADLPDTQQRDSQMVSLIHELLPHELNHAVFAKKFPAWFEEAMAEHIALCVKQKDVQALRIIDPRERDDQGQYEGFRTVLATLLRDGREPLRAALATRAYTSEGLNGNAWHRLESELDRSWGMPNVMRRITAGIERYQKYIQDHEPNLSKKDVIEKAAAWAVKGLTEYVAKKRAAAHTKTPQGTAVLKRAS